MIFLDQCNYKREYRIYGRKEGVYLTGKLLQWPHGHTRAFLLAYSDGIACQQPVGDIITAERDPQDPAL